LFRTGLLHGERKRPRSAPASSTEISLGSIHSCLRDDSPSPSPPRPPVAAASRADAVPIAVATLPPTAGAALLRRGERERMAFGVGR